MTWTRLLPHSVQSVLRPRWRRWRARWPAPGRRHKSLARTHRYWRDPPDAANRPENYLLRTDRSGFLLEMVRRYARPGASVLEIGCNAGRNLALLYANGWRDLTGVEISPGALELLTRTYPEMARRITLINAPVEEVIRSFRPAQFHVTFTMAVLEHVHARSEWIFPEIARITGSCLITIEDEQGTSWRHFPRNYQDVFERCGWTQLEAVDFRSIKPAVFSPDFHARIFGRDSDGTGSAASQCSTSTQQRMSERYSLAKSPLTNCL